MCSDDHRLGLLKGKYDKSIKYQFLFVSERILRLVWTAFSIFQKYP